MGYQIDFCTEEDRDFIVDDGYKHEEDTTNISDDDKNDVTGKDFDNLTTINNRVIKRLKKMHSYSNNEEVLN